MVSARKPWCFGRISDLWDIYKLVDPHKVEDLLEARLGKRNKRRNQEMNLDNFQGHLDTNQSTEKPWTIAQISKHRRLQRLRTSSFKL